MQRKVYVLSYDSDRSKIRIAEVIAFDTPNEAQVALWELSEKIKKEKLGGEKDGSERDLGSYASGAIQDNRDDTGKEESSTGRSREGNEEGHIVPCQPSGSVRDNQQQV
jgi:hypothetical protein